MKFTPSVEVPLVGAHTGCSDGNLRERTLADAVALPSSGDPESSRRDTLVVDKPIKDCLREESASSFGPTITVGEPFCTDSGNDGNLQVSDHLQSSRSISSSIDHRANPATTAGP